MKEGGCPSEKHMVCGGVRYGSALGQMHFMRDDNHTTNTLENPHQMNASNKIIGDSKQRSYPEGSVQSLPVVRKKEYHALFEQMPTTHGRRKCPWSRGSTRVLSRDETRTSIQGFWDSSACGPRTWSSTSEGGQEDVMRLTPSSEGDRI